MPNLFELFKYSKLLKVADGELSLMGVPVNIVPTNILCSLQNGLINAIGLDKAYKQIYESAKEGSREYNTSFTKIQRFKDKRKTLGWQTKILSFAGWGNVEIAKIDFAENSLVAQFKKSPFPLAYKKMYGKTSFPVDIIPAGFNAGGLSVMAKKEIEVIETKCVAMGHPFCEFEAGTPDVIEARRKELWQKWKLI